MRRLKLLRNEALRLVMGSALVGIGGGFAAAWVMGLEWWQIVAGLVIGVMVFPLTFGAVFPFGVPLVCGVLAWQMVRIRGSLSRWQMRVMFGLSAAGWFGVVLIGSVLGAA